jgi:F-type H+-transporting ATPase subunit delta
VASVTNTYARAFADVVFDGRLDGNRILAEIQSLADLVASSKELREVWETPAIPAEQKRAVLDALVKRENFSRPVRNFVAVLIDHGRVGFLDPIVKQFERELYLRMGFADAEITSARQLNDAERHALEGDVEKLIGKKVRARYQQDPSVLGGAIVRVGSTIYDGSVKGQLDKIKEAISS